MLHVNIAIHDVKVAVQVHDDYPIFCTLCQVGKSSGGPVGSVHAVPGRGGGGGAAPRCRHALRAHGTQDTGRLPPAQVSYMLGKKLESK